MNSAISTSTLVPTLMLAMLLATAPHAATAKVIQIEWEAAAAPESGTKWGAGWEAGWEFTSAPQPDGGKLALLRAVKMATVPEPGFGTMLLIGLVLLGLRIQLDPDEEKFGPVDASSLP